MPDPQRPAIQRWRYQCPHCHLQVRAERGLLSPSLMPPTSLNYCGDRPVSTTQQSPLHPPYLWTQPKRCTAVSVIQYIPFPATLLLKATVLPSLRKLGRLPYMIRLPCFRKTGWPTTSSAASDLPGSRPFFSDYYSGPGNFQEQTGINRDNFYKSVIYLFKIVSISFSFYCRHEDWGINSVRLPINF